MPLYEYKQNAENKIEISSASRNSLSLGTENTYSKLAEAILSANAPCRVAIDTYYGIDYIEIARELNALIAGRDVEIAYSNQLFVPSADIAAYKRRFIDSDESFGIANRAGRMADIYDPNAVRAYAERLTNAKDVMIMTGPGALAEGLEELYDIVVYAEKTRQPMLWQMWAGELMPLGSIAYQKDYFWKEYYYCDYYLLNDQKKKCVERMDYYVDANDMRALKLLPKAAYDEILKTLVRYPIKEIRIFQPGPWGAYRYKDLFNVPGLECNAWNELAGPELGVMIDVGLGECITMPFVSLLKHGDALVGKYINSEYPDLFPMDIWLDDGYFPKPEPAERTSMPIHNHPSTDYVKRRFGEPLGRYETYYIAEAYKGANTWMGYKDDADLEKWEALCRASKNQVPIPNWKDFVCNWDSNVGDLYLIPPGTAHAHGGNQMVLEMDTCPSISGTEYSFFTYDFARNSWDDDIKQMSGKPCRMQLEHSFDNDHYRRESWVKQNLLSRPKVETWTNEYQKDVYASLPEMPFEIERFRFETRALNDTLGKFCHIVTVTIGARVRVVSKSDRKLFCEIDKFQSCVVPACFGEYEFENLGGGYTEVVLIHWKKG